RDPAEPGQRHRDQGKHRGRQSVLNQGCGALPAPPNTAHTFLSMRFLSQGSSWKPMAMTTSSQMISPTSVPRLSLNLAVSLTSCPMDITSSTTIAEISTEFTMTISSSGSFRDAAVCRKPAFRHVPIPFSRFLTGPPSPERTAADRAAATTRTRSPRPAHQPESDLLHYLE